MTKLIEKTGVYFLKRNQHMILFDLIEPELLKRILKYNHNQWLYLHSTDDGLQ